ncbi:hypothetical protein [Streptomyces lacrimifluminis]
MTRLLPAVLIGACMFAVAWAASAPLWLAVLVGAVSAAVAWRLNRNP